MRADFEQIEMSPAGGERKFLMVWMLRLLAIFILLPVAGWVYQRVGVWRDRRRYAGSGKTARGRMVEVGSGDAGGRKAYVQEMGPEGADASSDVRALPTVVFESGIAASSQNWCEMQRRVAEYARTVSYDRAGLGWSCESDCARTPANLARELRELLRVAGTAGPYVLVGHSFGGLIARRFAAEYADDVAGVVLVDPMRPEEWPPLDESRRATMERGAKFAGYGALAAHVGITRLGMRSMLCGKGWITGLMQRAAGKGGAHLAERITGEMAKMPREVWPIVAAHWSSPKFFRGFAAHIGAVPESVMEMWNAPPLGVPVTLVIQAEAKALDEAELARIGSNVRQVTAEKSGHWVHLDEPEVVLAAVREMLAAVTAREFVLLKGTA
jgi:pimeloyl-ACP methyl ester carboxylesterase